MAITRQNERLDGPGRLRSLDGLRGVAAFVVLAHHALLIVPAFSSTYGDGTDSPPRDSLVWWISYTPLKLLTAGGEAVIVFFVLSGVVLTLSVLERSDFNWIAYYPQRILRLWLPVVASVALASVWILIVPQTLFEPAATWLSIYSTPHPALAQFVSAINMFDHSGGAFHINNPLWSLSWELAFSLALPMFVVLSIVLRRWWVAAIAGVVLLTAAGRWFDSEPLEFLPAFLAGALIAAKFDDLRAATMRLGQRRSGNAVWLLVLVIGSLALVAAWLVAPWLPTGTRVVLLLSALTPLGAGMIVVVCFGWAPLGRVLSTPVFRWAGKISFSLYLVHVPVLIFTVYLLRGMDLRLCIALGAALAVVIACGFYWAIESRCHRLAREIGRRASSAYLSFVAAGPRGRG